MSDTLFCWWCQWVWCLSVYNMYRKPGTAFKAVCEHCKNIITLTIFYLLTQVTKHLCNHPSIYVYLNWIHLFCILSGLLTFYIACGIRIVFHKYEQHNYYQDQKGHILKFTKKIQIITESYAMSILPVPFIL